MSYFSQSKAEPEKKSLARVESETKAAPALRSAPAQSVSKLGRDVTITGNIVSTGAIQVAGRVTGDIHAAQLMVCEGAQIEGKIIAPEAIVQGTFKGTIHSNTVKLQGSAVVEGEIFNKSLSIEQEAQFEGISRRLEKPVEPPSSAHVSRQSSAPAAAAPAAAPPLAPAQVSTAEVISFAGPAADPSLAR